MSRAFQVCFLVTGLFVIGCGQPQVEPPKVPLASATAAISNSFSMDDFSIAEPIRFANLTIFPVTSRVPKTDDRFITLDEGLKAGTIEIRELAASAGAASPDAERRDDAITGRPINPVEFLTPQRQPDLEAERQAPGAAEPAQTSAERQETREIDDLVTFGMSNDVNCVMLVNNSDKPLYLMPGEVIIGGSQDRTIGQELVIAAHSQPTRVPVFCVEHGRWGAKGAAETLAQLNSATSSETLDDSVAVSQAEDLQQLAQQADQGKFVASVGQLGKQARVAVQSDKNQSAVWDRVAAINARSGVTPNSGAFTANYVAEHTLQQIEPYLDHLQRPVADLQQPVGILVAINGKIESIDVFESTPLFLKLWPKLLKSYALDAANAREESDEIPQECTLATARSFFAEALQGNVESSEQEHGIALIKRDSQHVMSFTSRVAQPADGDGDGIGGGGLGGGGVHFSGFAK